MRRYILVALLILLPVVAYAQRGHYFKNDASPITKRTKADCISPLNCTDDGGDTEIGIDFSAAFTHTGAVSFSGSGTFTFPISDADQTTDGLCDWDTTAEHIECGATVGGTRTFAPYGATGAGQYCVWDDTNKEIDCNDAGASGMTSWTVAGDSGSEAVADAETATWVGGEGITTAEDGVRQVTISFTPGEIIAPVWGDNVSRTWLWDSGGASDPQVVFADDSIAFSNAATFTVDTNAVIDASDNITALTGVTTVSDGDYCQGGATSSMDCDVTTIPVVDGGTGVGTSTGTTNVVLSNGPTLVSPIVNTSLQIPVDDTTLGVDGEITVDETDDQFQYRASTATYAIHPEETKCFTLETPVAGDTNIPIWITHPAITITEISCLIDGATNIVGVFSDGTNDVDTTDLTCTATRSASTALENATFTANERLEWDTTSASGTPTFLSACFTYTVDPT